MYLVVASPSQVFNVNASQTEKLDPAARKPDSARVFMPASKWLPKPAWVRLKGASPRVTVEKNPGLQDVKKSARAADEVP
jgi:hypothetical protein